MPGFPCPTDCDGCRYCCNPADLDGDAPPIHRTELSDTIERIRATDQRHGLFRRNRRNN